MEKLVWTPDLINTALTDKQKKLSAVMNLLPDIQEEFDTAGNQLELKEAELRLKFETYNDEKLSDKKIWSRIVTNEDYQVLKAEYIILKSKLKKCKTEIEILRKEMKTLDSIGVNTSVDLKYLNKQEG